MENEKTGTVYGSVCLDDHVAAAQVRLFTKDSVFSSVLLCGTCQG